MSENTAYAGWAIVELFGHRRLAGRVSEAQQYGTTMLRLDIPKTGSTDETYVTTFYGGAAIYSMSPCDEALARSVASYSQPDPTPLTRRLGGGTDHIDGDDPPDSDRGPTF